MNCIYCQKEMKQYAVFGVNTWMCYEHYHHQKSPVRVDHYYYYCDNSSQELYIIKFVVFRREARFPYRIELNLRNKTLQLHHYPNFTYNPESHDDCIRANEFFDKDEPIITLDFIPENLNPDTVNQYLDRLIKLLPLA